MPTSRRILLIEPSANLPREAIDLLVPEMSSLTHRVVNNPTELKQVLQSENWDAVVCSTSLPAAENFPTLFANLPGMACQIRLDTDGALHFKYVSAGSMALFGLSPIDIEHKPQLLLDMIHPDDREIFYRRMRDSLTKAGRWNWEGRVVMPPKGEIKWVNLRATPRTPDGEDPVWEGFLLNITQNKQSEMEIKQSRERLRELSSHIETIKEQERTRIAREIHDDIGVLLTALKLDLAWLTQRLPGSATPLHDKAKTMSDLLITAGVATNNLVHSLRPSFLDHFGIVATIEMEAKEFTKRTGIPCSFVRSDDNIELSPEQSITLFRVFQETLNNIMKHAQAKQVQIRFLKEKSCIYLIVADDGKGFDDGSRNKPRSFGLRGMEERIEHLGGTVDISSQQGKGTTVSVCIPL